MNSRRTSFGRNPTIDALRALAALSVLIHHLISEVPLGISAIDAALAWVVQHGGHGVDMFFVLSGYCIHRGTLVSKRSFDTRAYFDRRFWRIYPPYFFAMIFALFLIATGVALKLFSKQPIPSENFTFFQIATHLFLIHNLFGRSVAALNGPFWTIAVEAQYYLIYPVARRLMAGMGWIRLFAIALGLHIWAWTAAPTTQAFQPLHPFQFWIQWVLGAWAAHLEIKYPEPIHRLWLVWIIMAAGISTLVIQPLAFLTPVTEPVTAGLICFFGLLGLLALPERVWGGWAGALPAIGIFSYSIYLVHYPIVDRWRILVLERAPEGWMRLGLAIVGFGLALGATWLFFIPFEKPYLTRRPKTG